MKLATILGRQSGETTAVRQQSRSAVFAITHKTVRRFTLSEILLMAAINQLEAKRKVDRR